MFDLEVWDVQKERRAKNCFEDLTSQLQEEVKLASWQDLDGSWKAVHSGPPTPKVLYSRLFTARSAIATYCCVSCVYVTGL